MGAEKASFQPLVNSDYHGKLARIDLSYLKVGILNTDRNNQSGFMNFQNISWLGDQYFRQSHSINIPTKIEYVL